jgi:putative intracellular protease/amidase
MTFASPDQSRLMDRAAPQLRKSPVRDNQHFVFLLLDQFTHLAFSCAVEPLRLANHSGERELYSWETCSEDGSVVQASNGVRVAVDRSLGTLTARETLVVVGGRTPKNSVSSTLMAQVRKLQAHGVKIISVCGATSVLAAAGVIKNQTCAVHWDISDAFSELHPSVEIVEGCVHPRPHPDRRRGRRRRRPDAPPDRAGPRPRPRGPCRRPDGLHRHPRPARSADLLAPGALRACATATSPWPCS